MFLPHFAPISSDGMRPQKWLMVMHGIYGRGGNWRSFARKLCEKRSDWGLLLTDLRMHGESIAAPAPHNLGACASDMLALIDQQAQEGRVVAAVLGHSFGGKVALAMRQQRPSLPPIWLVDSSPSARPKAIDDPRDTVVSVLRMLETLPDHFATREKFVEAVISQSFDKNLAMWLAMNLESTTGGFRLRLDLAAMRELLTDYFSRDLWPVLEARGEAIHVVCASRGSALSSDDLSRLEKLVPNSGVQVHPLEGGHWLHVDALEPLVDLVAAHLS